MSMMLPGRVLVFADGATTRALLCQSIEQVGVDADTAEDDNEAIEYLEGEARIALVVTCVGQPDDSGLEFVRRTAYTHPNVPIVIVGDCVSTVTERELQSLGIGRILKNPLAPEDLQAEVIDALSQNLYDGAVVECLKQSVTDVLKGARIECAVTAGEPYQRVSGKALSDISAVVGIRGPALWGKLVLSSTPVLFAQIRRRWVNQHPVKRDVLWDAAGEIANRMASDISRHYASRGLPANQTHPVIIEGTHVSLHHDTDQPVLVLPCTVEGLNDHLYVQWILGEKAADGPPPEHSLSAGEVEFW